MYLSRAKGKKYRTSEARERARRIEEAKLNKGKKKKTEKKHDEDEDKIPGSVKEHSRVGLRQYVINPLFPAWPISFSISDLTLNTIWLWENKPSPSGACW